MIYRKNTDIGILSKDKPLVFLADLTHTGSVISSNTHPLGIGLVASYLLTKNSGDIDVELFKYPEDLSFALKARTPHIMGFSNYSWNCNLAYQYALRVKKKSPETVIVFGGPNYGLSSEEVKSFWRQYPICDFYILREGENAMVELFRTLSSCDFDLKSIKIKTKQLPNCHYMASNELISGPDLPRIDVNEIPSPYLLGLMDKFFDDLLMPMVYTTRGCPFSCTYCGESGSYYKTISHRCTSQLSDELEYIARRVSPSHELSITDANFGMYLQDIEKARVIADIQEKYNWPKFMSVTNGKRHPERIVEIASILDGAMLTIAAIQSTDPNVLKNIARSNLSLEDFRSIARFNSTMDGDTVTDIILALPGDTPEAHERTLKDAINADFSILRVYQLIMIPQTEIISAAARSKYGIKTKFRIMPRSFGQYEVFNEVFDAVEYEEICIETNSLSFDEYLRCRELDLTIEIFHNGGIFLELAGLCKRLDFSWFDFLMRIFNQRRSFADEITELYDFFKEGATEKLWDAKAELEKYVKTNMDLLLNDENGTNEIATAKSIAFWRLTDLLHQLLFDEMKKLLDEHKLLDKVMLLYLKELKEYSLSRKKDLIDPDKRYHGWFHFDFNAIRENEFVVDPEDYRLPHPQDFIFFHNKEQKKMITRLIGEYGTSIDGLGRILMIRAHLRKLFRNIKKTS